MHSLSSRPEAGATKATTNKADLVSQKGKEVAGRDKLEKVAMEKVRREKEEAAKKARAKRTAPAPVPAPVPVGAAAEPEAQVSGI